MARHTRRLILWISGGVLALVLLAVLAVVALVWLVDPNVYKPRIASAATQSLGRPVTLGGDLRWSIGWDIGIESMDGAIGNAPGFSEVPIGKQPFMRWRGLRLGLDTRALLGKRVVIDRLEVDGLELNLQRNAAGEGNWTFPPAISAADTGATADLQIASIHLRDSKLSFTDVRDAATPSKPVIWQLDDVSLDVDLPADLKASVRELGDVTLSGRLKGEPLPAEGVPLAFEAASVRHDAGARTLDLPEFRARWMEAELTGDVHAVLKQEGATSPAARGKMKLRVPSVRTLLASLETTVPPMADPDTLGRLDVESGFDLKDGTLSVPDLQAKLDDTTLSGRVSVTKFSPLALRFDLVGDAIDLDRYLEPAGHQGKPMELPLAQLKALDAKGVLRLKSAKVAGATAEELRIDVE